MFKSTIAAITTLIFVTQGIATDTVPVDLLYYDVIDGDKLLLCYENKAISDDITLATLVIVKDDDPKEQINLVGDPLDDRSDCCSFDFTKVPSGKNRFSLNLLSEKNKYHGYKTFEALGLSSFTGSSAQLFIASNNKNWLKISVDNYPPDAYFTSSDKRTVVPCTDTAGSTDRTSCYERGTTLEEATELFLCFKEKEFTRCDTQTSVTLEVPSCKDEELLTELVYDIDNTEITSKASSDGEFIDILYPTNGICYNIAKDPCPATFVSASYQVIASGQSKVCQLITLYVPNVMFTPLEDGSTLEVGVSLNKESQRNQFYISEYSASKDTLTDTLVDCRLVHDQQDCLSYLYEGHDEATICIEEYQEQDGTRVPSVAKTIIKTPHKLGKDKKLLQVNKSKSIENANIALVRESDPESVVVCFPDVSEVQDYELRLTMAQDNQGLCRQVNAESATVNNKCVAVNKQEESVKGRYNFKLTRQSTIKFLKLDIDFQTDGISLALVVADTSHRFVRITSAAVITSDMELFAVNTETYQLIEDCKVPDAVEDLLRCYAISDVNFTDVEYCLASLLDGTSTSICGTAMSSIDFSPADIIKSSVLATEGPPYTISSSFMSPYDKSLPDTIIYSLGTDNTSSIHNVCTSETCNVQTDPLSLTDLQILEVPSDQAVMDYAQFYPVELDSTMASSTILSVYWTVNEYGQINPNHMYKVTLSTEGGVYHEEDMDCSNIDDGGHCYAFYWDIESGNYQATISATNHTLTKQSLDIIVDVPVV